MLRPSDDHASLFLIGSENDSAADGQLHHGGVHVRVFSRTLASLSAAHRAVSPVNHERSQKLCKARGS
jgi:hypothetical protein